MDWHHPLPDQPVWFSHQKLVLICLLIYQTWHIQTMRAMRKVRMRMRMRMRIGIVMTMG